MLNNKLKLIVSVLSIVLIMGMITYADSIDDQNNAFRVVIEELQNRITALEGDEGGESHLIYPQKWATGDGTESNPWTNNCIQKAYDAVPVGGTIFLRAGYYALSAQVSISKQISIIGEGIGKTIIKTANATGFSIDTDYFTIKDLTVDGDAQTDGTEYLSCIRIGTYSEYALFENIEVENAGYYGFNIYEVNNSLWQNVYAHDNHRHGFHPASDRVGWNLNNTYRDIYAWNNGQLGFADRGNGESGYPIVESNNVYDNLQCWENGSYGIQIAYQKNIVLTSSFTWGNANSGISIEGIKDSIVSNCFATLNGGVTQSGIIVNLSDNIHLTNVIAKNNHNGITIYNSNNIGLTSCSSYDDRDTPLQNCGLILYGTNTGICLLNCILSPNASVDIYNPNNTIINQWPSSDSNLIKLTEDFDALLVRIQVASEAINE